MSHFLLRGTGFLLKAICLPILLSTQMSYSEEEVLGVPAVAQWISGVSAVAGPQGPSLTQRRRLKIRHCICGVDSNSNSDLIPAQGIPYVSGQPKKEEKEKKIQFGFMILRLILISSCAWCYEQKWYIIWCQEA